MFISCTGTVLSKNSTSSSSINASDNSSSGKKNLNTFELATLCSQGSSTPMMIVRGQSSVNTNSGTDELSIDVGGSFILPFKYTLDSIVSSATGTPATTNTGSETLINILDSSNTIVKSWFFSNYIYQSATPIAGGINVTSIPNIMIGDNFTFNISAKPVINFGNGPVSFSEVNETFDITINSQMFSTPTLLFGDVYPANSSLGTCPDFFQPSAVINKNESTGSFELFYYGISTALSSLYQRSSGGPDLGNYVVDNLEIKILDDSFNIIETIDTTNMVSNNIPNEENIVLGTNITPNTTYYLHIIGTYNILTNSGIIKTVNYNKKVGFEQSSAGIFRNLSGERMGFWGDNVNEGYLFDFPIELLE